MNIDPLIVSRLLYVPVFTGCYVYLTWNIRCRTNRALAVAVLAAGVAAVHFPDEFTVFTLLACYLFLTALYWAWSLLFLETTPRYALYLSVFFSIFMGVWISCVQVLFLCLGVDNRWLRTLCTGVCRVLSIAVIKRRFIRVDGSRTIGMHELLLGLFPAAACFVANLQLYDYLLTLPELRARYGAFYIYFSVLFFGFAAILVLLSSESYFRLIRYREESERMQRQMEAQYQRFVREQEANRDLRALRHDLRNHLDTLEAMTHASDVKTYIAGLRRAEEETEPAFFTGNDTLDALLLTKRAAFARHGIDFSCRVHLPHMGFLPPMEICALFANGIDNAVEAAADEPPGKRWINMAGGEVNGNLVVRLENPYAHSLARRDGLFASTKDDRSAHGFGLMNMRRIVEMHGGTMTFKTDGGVFSLFFMIPIESA